MDSLLFKRLLISGSIVYLVVQLNFIYGQIYYEMGVRFTFDLPTFIMIDIIFKPRNELNLISIIITIFYMIWTPIKMFIDLNDLLMNWFPEFIIHIHCLQLIAIQVFVLRSLHFDVKDWKTLMDKYQD